MFRLKALSVLACSIAMLALSVAPAYAEWESKQTTGSINVLNPGEFKYPKSNFVKCPAAEIKAQWQIQVSGQIKQQQNLTTKGPHLQVQVKSWGPNCVAKFSGTEITKEVKVSECDFQLVQAAGVFTATAGVSKRACVVEVPNLCKIQIPPGMETSAGSGKGINVGLSAVALSNVGSNQLDKVNITKTAGGQGGLPGEGIYGTASGISCLGVASSTEEAELIGLEFEAEGVKAV